MLFVIVVALMYAMTWHMTWRLVVMIIALLSRTYSNAKQALHHSPLSVVNS